MIFFVCKGRVAWFLRGAEQQLCFLLPLESPDNICHPWKHKPILWTDKGKRNYYIHIFFTLILNLSQWTSLSQGLSKINKVCLARHREDSPSF